MIRNRILIGWSATVQECDERDENDADGDKSGDNERNRVRSTKSAESSGDGRFIRGRVEVSFFFGIRRATRWHAAHGFSPFRDASVRADRLVDERFEATAGAMLSETIGA
jgi:hypothetical protein